MIDSYKILETIAEKKPLIHHITNWVTIYDCANMTRAFGALPVMAHAREEVEEMVNIASALVLNIGTLTPELIETMVIAAKAANKKGIPIVLDAVGAGATRLRTESCMKLINESRIDILKGNYGEIGVLAGVEAEVKGVESMGLSADPDEVAKKLSDQLGNTVVMTGKRDIIASKNQIIHVDNGCMMMGSIVGTGCMAGSIIGSFAAVEPGLDVAAAAALCCYGIAGEIAAESAKGPGSFKELFFDAVSNLDKEKIDARACITTL